MHLDGVKKFNNIIDKWKQTKNKEIVYENVDTKVNTKKFDIYKIFENYLNKKIDYDGIDNIKNGIKIYHKRLRTDKNKSIINNSNKVIKGIELFKSMINNDEFKIPGEYYAKPNNNVDLDWMNDKIRYAETAKEADADYMKGNNDNELTLRARTVFEKTQVVSLYWFAAQHQTSTSRRQKFDLLDLKFSTEFNELSLKF